MAPKLGFKGKLYQNTGATWAAPTWTLREDISDVSNAADLAEIDVSSRASKYKRTDQGQIDVGVDVTIPNDENDDFYRLLSRSFYQGTVLDLWIASGVSTTTYSDGVRAKWKCYSFARAEPIDGAQQTTATLKPYYDGTNDPQRLICLPKATTSGSAIADATVVYWDATNSVVTETVGTNDYLGKTFTASADGDAYCYVDTSIEA